MKGVMGEQERSERKGRAGRGERDGGLMMEVKRQGIAEEKVYVWSQMSHRTRYSLLRNRGILISM